MSTLGKTGSGTGRSDSLVNNLGMSECGNYLLRHENAVTNRAVLTLGNTCVDTVGSDGLVNCLCMAVCLTLGRLTNDTGLCLGTGSILPGVA